MAKMEPEEKARDTREYYKLHIEAVEDLATADESNSPEVPLEELKKYRSVHRFKLSDWMKICFIKWWFPAAVCFFFIWGLGTYVGDLLDLLFITGIALGIVTDLLTNNAIRFFASFEGQYDRWMMFPKKGYMSFPLNIIYAWVIVFFVYTIYNVINLAVISLCGITDQIPLGVEPICFGIFCLLTDLMFIGIKHTVQSVFRDARAKALTEH